MVLKYRIEILRVLQDKIYVVEKIFRPLKLDKTRTLIPVDSVAQCVGRRSRNPEVRVQIPLEPTNFSLVLAV